MTQYEDKSQHPDAAELGQTSFTQGREHYSAESFDEARRCFEAALEYTPEDGQAWFALGNCHDGMKNPAKAEICYRMSLRFSPPDSQSNVYYNLANSLFDQQRFAQAVECYAKVDEQSKAYSAAQKNMTMAQGRLS